MYNVFIVEDEPLIRDTLRNHLLDLEQSTDFRYCGEAADGEIALSMIRELKPDILITDIKMPFMDGLALSELTRKLFPWIHILIISGYADFSFSKKAIELGVEGYLTKPVLIDELHDALNRIKTKEIDEHSIQHKPSNIEETLNKELYIEHFLNKLQRNGYQLDEIHEREKRLGTKLVGKTFCLISGRISDTTFTKSDYSSLLLKTHELFNDDQQILFSLSDELTYIGIISGNSEDDAKNKTYWVADVLKNEWTKKKFTAYYTMVGPISVRLSELSSSLLFIRSFITNTQPKKKAQLIENFISLKKNEKSVLFLTDLKLLLSSAYAHLPLTSVIDQIQTQLLYLDVQKKQPAQYQLLTYLNTNLQTEYQQSIYSDKDINYLSSSDKLFSLGLKELLTVTRIYSLPVEKNDTSSVSSNSSYLVKRTVSYLDEYYSNPEISLQFVAESVLKINPTYLSTVFSQIKGMTFIEYLTKLRINKAKHLLQTTTSRITDITFDIGYNDPNYFSFLFKKNVGISPKEYRNQQNDIL